MFSGQQESHGRVGWSYKKAVWRSYYLARPTGGEPCKLCCQHSRYTNINKQTNKLSHSIIRLIVLTPRLCQGGILYPRCHRHVWYYYPRSCRSHGGIIERVYHLKTRKNDMIYNFLLVDNVTQWLLFYLNPEVKLKDNLSPTVPPPTSSKERNIAFYKSTRQAETTPHTYPIHCQERLEF